MARLSQKEIQKRAFEVLEAHPDGIRWTDLVQEVGATTTDTPHNSIRGATHTLVTTRASEIIKVARGFYRLAKYIDSEDKAALTTDTGATPIPIKADTLKTVTLTEQDFYSSFAEWLEENDEATVAEPLGGASLGGKWGTPDVIGVLKPRAQDIFKFEPQIITAEIKAVPGQPVVAFGQAVAYRLFSHKVYIVVPSSTNVDDMSRLKSLCSIHGVGLVIFELNKESPDYSMIVLPINATPDMFYVNSMLENLKKNTPTLLNKLF